MRWSLRAVLNLSRKLHHSAPSPSAEFRGRSVEALAGQDADLHTFRQRAFVPQMPLLLKNYIQSLGNVFPAFRKWFLELSGSSFDAPRDPAMTFSPYMEQFQEWPFPYELLIPSGSGPKKSVLHFRDWLLSQENRMDSALAEMLQPVLADSSTDQRFFQLYGPLRLLMRTLEFNRTMLKSVSCPIQLYIAQSLIPNLAPALQEDVPTPELVLSAGKGDVYGSSVWLGSEPTYTPLHRDPNPNLFYQLCGSKSLRIMPPAHGDRIFAQVQARLGRYGGNRIRTSEMMEGAERKLLYEMVWENEPQGEVYGVDVGPGDALFIPRGWWHSVKSAGAEGHLNSSVNWWFR